MGFKEDRFVDKNQETYPMASRYKKNTQAQVGRKATEINLSHFVRNKKLENRKRNISRTSNRSNKYKTTLTLLEDEDASLPIGSQSQIPPTTPKKRVVPSTPNVITPPNATTTQRSLHKSESDHSDSDTDVDSVESSPSSSHKIPSPEMTRTPSGRNAIPMSPAGRMIRSTTTHTPNGPAGKSTPNSSSSSPFASSLPSGLLSPAPSLASNGVSLQAAQTLQKMNTTDAVSAAVFQALFGTPTSRLRSSLRWDEESSEDEEDDADMDLYHFRTIEPVDQLWFSKLVSNSLLATKALQYAIAKNIPADTSLPPDALLSEYLKESFLTSLLEQLPFEDDRITSPRVSVLKAVFKNCSGSRQFLANGLRQVSYLRLLRCKSSSRFAVHFEIDPNAAASIIGDNYDYISKSHMLSNALAMFTTPSADVHTNGVNAIWLKDTATVTSNGCGVANVKNDKNKKKLLFPSMGSTTGAAGDSDSNCKALKNSESASNTTTVTRDHDSAIVELAVFMVLTSFEESTYGNQDIDGNQDSCVDDLDSPSCTLYDTVLAVFVNVLRCYGRRLGKTTEGVEQPAVLRGVLKGLELLLSRAPPGIHPIDKHMLPTILHAWPGGGNSIREVAFLRVVGLILGHYRSSDPPLPNRPSITNHYRASSCEDNSNPCPSIPSLLTSFPTVPPRFKCLFKIVKCINSVHFKVCLQAIGIMLSDMVLAMIVHNQSDGEGDNDTGERSSTSSDVNEGHKIRLLNSLVEALRKNRNHWNVSVRESSEVGLDRLLDVM